MAAGTERPLLKWVGGKADHAGAVLDALPAEVAAFHEPFLGGGAILLEALARIGAGRLRVLGGIYASDANEGLVNFWEVVQKEPARLLEALAPFVEEHRAQTDETGRAAHYYRAREALRSGEGDAAARAAVFLFVNRTCFRGLYREGPRGFNAPFGHYAAPAFPSAAHVFRVSCLVQPVVFRAQDFTAALAEAGPGCAVYLDPPNACADGAPSPSFTRYLRNDFDEERQRELFDEARRLRSLGAAVALSNANAQVVRDAFPAPDWEATPLIARRRITPKRPGAVAPELLVRSV